MERTEHSSVSYYHYPKWGNVKHGIFTRLGGVSKAPWVSLNVGSTVGDELASVQENGRRMYGALGVNAKRVISTWLVHGTDVVTAQSPLPTRSWLAKADGIITNQPDLPLSMRYADCVPLLFYDPVKSVIGIAHAGWRGTVNGMASSVIRKMQQVYACEPADIQVVIGPSISQKCYQVGEEVVAAVDSRFNGETQQLIWRNPEDGTAYFDLWKANELDLRRGGVSHIHVAGICTYQNIDEFFSHRAEKGRTGRFGAVISL